MMIPRIPSSAMPSIRSKSSLCSMSFWIATGRTRSSTKARTVSWISRCSSLSSKSTLRVYSGRIGGITRSTGLSFELSPEQRSLRELAHEFAEREIRPRAAEYDEHQTHPAEVIAKAHGLGLMNLHVPRECGGPALGLLEGAL